MSTMRELIDEFASCDSVSRRNELEELLVTKLDTYVSARWNIDNKYGVRSNWIDSDYNANRGYWSYKDDNYFTWEHNRSESACSYTVKGDEIETFDPAAYERHIISVKRDILVADVKRKELDLDSAKTALKQFKHIHNLDEI